MPDRSDTSPVKSDRRRRKGEPKVNSKMLFQCVIAIAGFLMTISSESIAQQTAEPPAKEVPLVKGDWNDLTAYIRSQQGKIVVVDIWSTSCLPCMKEFPNLVKLQEKYSDRIACVSLNVDYVGIRTKPPETYEERVRKFLQSRNAHFRNFLCTTDAQKLFEDIRLDSIPAVFVYGADGKLLKRFDASLFEEGDTEPFNYEEDINPYVEKLTAALPETDSDK